MFSLRLFIRRSDYDGLLDWLENGESLTSFITLVLDAAVRNALSVRGGNTLMICARRIAQAYMDDFESIKE
jgi:hypothetical protein